MNLEQVRDNLVKRGYEAKVVTREEAIAYVRGKTAAVKSVGWGGSETVKALGLRDAIAADGVEIRDHRTDCDIFLLSANALTTSGLIVNIDGTKDYATVDNALAIVERLEHRAGKDASGETGDGVGIMLQVPHAFFSAVMAEQGISLGEERDYGVGMFFLSQNEPVRKQACKMMETIAGKRGVELIAWRSVPTDPSVLGRRALDCMPCIMQAFFRRPSKYERGLDFDRALYLIRREFEQSHDDDTYVLSMSSRTIVYKGMFLVGQLRRFYLDLQDSRLSCRCGNGPLWPQPAFPGTRLASGRPYHPEILRQKSAPRPLPSP